MKTVIMMVIAGLVMFASSIWAQVVEISSIDSNGQISWTAPSGSVCSVEWASGLTPSPEWQQDWDKLQSISCPTGEGTAEVPMFFRVNCLTNGLLWNYRRGSVGILGVSTNGYDYSWTQRNTVAGWFDLPAVSSEPFSLQWRENIYQDGDSTGSLSFRRSTDMAVLEMADYEREYTLYTNAPVGTTWTYQDYNGHYWEATIETNETITVPAGTFTCQRYRKTVIGAPPTSYILIWFEPGGGVKKVYANFDPPQVYELLSVEYGD